MKPFALAAATLALAAASLALAACASQSQIGPYVKSVTRSGPWLVVEKCMIDLDGDTLSESNCTSSQLPLYTLAPPMQVPAAQAPPNGGYAAPPQLPTAPRAPAAPALPHR